MDIPSLYKQVIEHLKQGQRPNLAFSPQEIDELVEKWRRNKDDPVFLKSWLAIIGHCQRDHLEFEEPLIKTLEITDHPNLIIFTLSALQKHIIGHYHKHGERIPQKVIKVLKNVLTHPDREVLEWLIKTIEEMGPQGIVFKEILIRKKPSFLQGLLKSRTRRLRRQIDKFLQSYRF